MSIGDLDILQVDPLTGGTDTVLGDDGHDLTLGDAGVIVSDIETFAAKDVWMFASNIGAGGNRLEGGTGHDTVIGGAGTISFDVYLYSLYVVDRR